MTIKLQTDQTQLSERPRIGRAVLRTVALPLLLSVVMASTAWAVVPEVKDGGNFFTPAALTKANRELAEIQKKYHKDLVIETFASVPADQSDAVKKMDKQAREQFFQRWSNDRAKSEGVEGVYVLITKDPGHVQIEVGHETRKKAFRVPEDRTQLGRIFIQAFQQKEYDRGLLEGVQFFEHKLSQNLGSTTAAHANAPALPDVIRQGVNKVGPIVHQETPKMAGWVWIVLLIIGIWIVFAIFRGIARALMGPRRYGPGPGGPGPGYGGAPGGYGGPGYGGGGGGGGGFMSGMLGGLFGAAAGNWLYDSFGRGGGMGGGAFSGGSSRGNEGPAASDADQDYSGSGGDFGDDTGGGGGGDFGGGGGDFGGGGGDFGGGGGDFGGGGGDFGGGGGDFGGGGGDFGGGGGDF